jgi:hypothetical protein
MPRLVRVLICYALWFLWALPIAPGLYVVGLGAPHCLSGKIPPGLGMSVAGCLWAEFVMGPSIIIIGPLAPADDVTSPWPYVLALAAVIAGMAALGSSMVRGWYRQI